MGSKKTTFENIADALPIIHAALVRNYPDLMQDDLRQLLDIGNYGEVCKALISSSGFVAKPGEEAPATQ